MRDRSSVRLSVRLGRPLAGFACSLVALACAPRQEPKAVSASEDTTQAPEATEIGEDRVATTRPPAEAAQPGRAEAPPTVVDPEAERALREREFARSLLANVPTTAGQLGVVFVAGQRTADLLWTIAVENRSEQTLMLAADTSLLELTLTPPSSESDVPTAEPNKKPPPSKTQVFGVRPKIAVDGALELEPGELVVASFDPRDYCPEELLVEGTEVHAAYGYFVGTEIRWERGKRVERALTDKPPFVLESIASADSPAQTAKVLAGAPFVLGETYPLSKLQLRADGDTTNLEAIANKDAKVPESPLQLRLADLGHAERSLYKVLQLTLTNQSRDPIDIVLKRELFSFEVVGPRGATTCLLEPTKVDPLSHNFTRLAPGASRSLPIRLPEACPSGTFDLPGQYSVMARYRSPSSGAEFGKSGFVGEVRAQKSSRFSVDPRPGQPSPKPFREIPPDSGATRPASSAPRENAPPTAGSEEFGGHPASEASPHE